MFHVDHEVLDSIPCVEQYCAWQKGIDIDFAGETLPHIVGEGDRFSKVIARLKGERNPFDVQAQFHFLPCAC